MRGRRVWLVAVVMACVAAVLVAVFWSRLPFVSAARTGPVAAKAVKRDRCVGPQGSIPMDMSVKDYILKCKGLSIVKDPLARQILADGKVSAEERQAARADFVSCLTRGGLIDVSVADDGQVTAGGPPGMSLDAINKVQGDCTVPAGTDFGDIDFIFQEQRDNPDNLTTEQSIQQEISCLVKAKLLPKEMSVNEFIKSKLSFDPSNPKVAKCMDD